MRTFITILLSLFADTLFAQQVTIARSGTQQLGNSLLVAIFDTRQNYTLQNGNSIVFKKVEPQGDMLTISGKHIKIPYGTITDESDTVEYFALLNLSTDSIEFTPQDWSLITIKEASDSDSNWKPVEYWLYSDCGNSYEPEYKLTYGQLFLIKTRRHTGDFKCLQRLRFRTKSDGILLSDPY